jgi:hypothetical protein
MAVARLWAATHDRLRRFQAVSFDHGIAPVEELLVKHLFICCPALWWNYFGSSLAEQTRHLVTESTVVFRGRERGAGSMEFV